MPQVSVHVREEPMHTLGLGQRNIRRREITDLIVLALLGQSTGASNIDCQQSGARVERLIVAEQSPKATASTPTSVISKAFE